MADKKKEQELLSWGKREASKGHSLNEIEAGLVKAGIDDSSQRNRILSEVDKQKKAEDYKKAAAREKQAAQKQGQHQNKSYFWIYILALIVIGAIAYLFYKGALSIESLIKNFK